jgi:D-tyrosyl-tRNA(Tyr) deacylase
VRAVVQRVLNAGVTVDGEYVGKIGRGYLVLLGVGHGDTRAEADKLWGKLRGLRINEDENGKTNLALADVDGEVLVVSQFTLFADCRHGRRPSFTDAGAPMLPTSSTSTS